MATSNDVIEYVKNNPKKFTRTEIAHNLKLSYDSVGGIIRRAGLLPLILSERESQYSSLQPKEKVMDTQWV